MRRFDVLKLNKKLGAILVGVAVVFSAMWFMKANRDLAGSELDPDLVVEDLVATEEWLDLMGGAMSEKAKMVAQIPLKDAAELFAFEKGLRPVGRVLGEDGMVEGGEVGGLFWTGYRFDEETSEAGLWGFLGEEVTEVMNAKFGFLRGDFENEERTSFRARVIFSGKGKLRGGEVAEFKSEQEIRWTLQENGKAPSVENDYLIDPAEWMVSAWTMKSARLMQSQDPLFREVTAEVIPDEKDRDLIESTEHGRHLEGLFSGGEIILRSGYGRFFTTDATAQHPGLSVVDINQDGFDDLYICVRFGRNLLFRNKGDGTFEEAAAEYGLDIEGLSAAAIFADFDNDGDQDVFIGRSLERSLYLRNDEGIFVDSSNSHVASPLPYLTTSLTAADYNGDGLLDIYFSTYGFAIRQPREQVASSFLQDYPAEEVSEKFVSPPNWEPYLNLPGPPNVLLLNKGRGRFEVSPLSEQLATWRETLQATWADYDLDGDPDLYVCNDFAPDQLYRNDGGTAFVDVTAEVGHERMRGFGMGASFGDFDNDLDLDLYVSNMFSKAGLRIIDQVGMKDERFRWSAEGNLLFANQGGQGFDFRSGEGSPFAPVAKADWSWGGQFGDFDNDGFLDLYVPNGYFTAPDAYAGELDL